MLRAGDVIDGRFEIEAPGGAGGMGCVYRARDRETGTLVAVKTSEGERELARRLEREGRILSQLSHPCIVRYVAHGATEGGGRFVAMEWLDGEDLASRLRAGPLSVPDAAGVAVAIARGLAVVHRRGIVHRDVKPGNVFLVGGALDRVKLVDFGIARVRAEVEDEPHARPTGADQTQSGAMLGTAGYMPPEQARGLRGIDGRADLYALGALIFRCVAGRAPFTGDSDLTVLLQSVLGDAPRLSDLAPAVPEALDDLVARLLARSPDDRPREASGVAEALLSVRADDAAAPVRTSRASLGPMERTLACLVLARSLPGESASDGAGGGATSPALQPIAGRHGGALHVLVDGSAVVTFVESSAPPTDLASRGARCALAIEGSWRGARVAVVAARAVAGAALPASEVIERAVALLARRESTGEEGGGPIVDRVTASLLGAGFDVVERDGELRVAGERAGLDAPRTLLGRPTPCVGRQRELAVVEGLLDDAIVEGAPRVALLTGPPGAGKSRLVHELCARLAARGPSAPAVWVARADPIASPLSLARSLLASALRVASGGDVAAELERVLSAVEPADRSRIAEFIGELMGVAPALPPSVQLAAARADPMLMADQTRRAFEDLLGAWASRRPAVLILDDLQWADQATVDLVDGALRAASGVPWLVLGAGRPETFDRVAAAWSRRDYQHIRLAPLSRRAATTLVRQILGGAIAAADVDAIVERSGGNAFYLEESIRAAAEGASDAMPETVVAMAQARLDRVSPDARRVLRAASVFGNAFWTGGVAVLLGKSIETTEDQLAVLVDQEIVTRRPSSRLPGQQELAFRHALVQEAAHRMLTDADRTLGHRLAATWLESAAESDPVVLAEHFEAGGEPGRAAAHWVVAARRAMEANDLAACVAAVGRGVARASPGAMRGSLHALAAEAHRWRGELKEALEAARAAVSELSPEDDAWAGAIGELAVTSGKLGDVERVAQLADELRALLGRARGAGSSPARVIAAVRVVAQLLYAGRYESADALLAAAERAADAAEPAVVARLLQARAMRALFAGDPGAYLEVSAASVERFEQVGDVRNACLQRSNVGYGLMEVGRYAEAAAELSRALETAERVGLSRAAMHARHNLGLALARAGRAGEGLAVELAACDSARAHGDKRVECSTRVYLALVRLERGEGAEAVDEARRAVAISSEVPTARPLALGVLARALLAAGASAEALSHARDAHGALVELGAVEEGESLVRLAHAESLLVEGFEAQGEQALGAARDRLLERAAAIGDAALRASFLENVPENARTIELAALHLRAAHG